MKGINVELNASSDTTQISLNDTLVRTLFQNLNGEKGQISMQEGLGKSNIKPPVNVLLSKILQNTATVTWERYIDLPTNGQITFYQVDVRDLNNNQVFFNANVTKVLTGLHSVDITGLVAVTDHSLAHNYIVKVIACNGNVLSNKETIVNLLTLEVAAGKASTPVVAYIPLNERHGLRITSSVANATSYNIYEMISGVAQKLNLSPIVAATLSYDHIGLDSYSLHIYKVEGISTGNTTVAGTAYSVNIQLSDACAPFLTLPDDPIPAVFTTPVSTKNTITIGWTDSTSPRVSKYHLLVKNTDTLAVIYDQDTQSRSTVSVPLTGLTVNQEYTVLLTTINEASLFYGTTFTTTRSAWTTTNAVTPAPTASVLADPTLGQRQLSVSWTTVTGGLSYKLSRTGPQLVGGVLTTTTQTFAVSPTTVGTTATFIDGDPANPPLNALQSYSFYTYTVTSENAGGDALPSVASNPTQTKAGPANAVTVSVSLVDILDTSITVRWTDPGGQIDTFNAILKTADEVQVGTAVSVTWVDGQTNYSATFSTSITQDTLYYVTVQTLNSNTPASADSAQFRTKITTPTGVITLANNGKVKLDLSWTALIGVTPTGYNLTRVDTTNAYSGSIGTISGSGPWTATVTITGTFVGFATGASFIATNSAGQVGGPPTLIVIGTVTSTGFTYTITNGLTPVAGAISSIYPATNLNSVTTSGSGPITYTDTSLTSFNEYMYSWSAVNAGGASGRSPYSLPLRTLPGDPVAVTNITKTLVTTSSARVGWTAAQSQVVKYRLTVTVRSSGVAVYDADVPKTSTYVDLNASTTDPDLELGTLYDIVIKTFNQADMVTGASATSTLTTLLDKPSKPTVDDATSQTSLVVRWNADPNATSHHFVRYAGGSTTGVSLAASSSNPYTDGTVVANTAYEYTLVATNAGGNSAESDKSTSVTTWAAKASTPNKPTTTVTEYNAITVSWTAVTVPAGVTVKYKVFRYPGAVDLGLVDGISTSATGLTENTPYTFTVQSWTTGGYSTESTASDSVTTYYKSPGNPTIGTITTADTQFDVSWTIGTGTITKHMVIAAASGYSTVTKDNLSPTATSVTVDGLTPDVVYTVGVYAYNNNPTNGYSSTTATTKPATPVMGDFTLVKYNTVTVNWTKVPGFKYHVYRNGTAAGNKLTSTLLDAATYTDSTSLVADTDYTYYVQSTSNTRTSNLSAFASKATKTAIAPPNPPTSLTISNSLTTSVTATWVAPTSGSAVASYEVRARASGALVDAFSASVPSGVTVQITSLTANTLYTVYVKSKNTTDVSAEISSPAITLAGQVTIGTVATSQAGITVNWTDQSTANVTSKYSIHRNSSTGAAIKTDATGASYLDAFSGLTVDTQYFYYVTSDNSTTINGVVYGGISAQSAKSNTVYSYPEVPGTPTVTATSVNSNLNVTLAIAHATTGGEVTSYKYAYQETTVPTVTTTTLALNVPPLDAEVLIALPKKATTYKFAVQAVRTNVTTGLSSLSTIASASYDTPAIPVTPVIAFTDAVISDPFSNAGITAFSTTFTSAAGQTIRYAYEGNIANPAPTIPATGYLSVASGTPVSLDFGPLVTVRWIAQSYVGSDSSTVATGSHTSRPGPVDVYLDQDGDAIYGSGIKTISIAITGTNATHWWYAAYTGATKPTLTTTAAQITAGNGNGYKDLTTDINGNTLTYGVAYSVIVYGLNYLAGNSPSSSVDGRTGLANVDSFSVDNKSVLTSVFEGTGATTITLLSDVTIISVIAQGGGGGGGGPDGATGPGGTGAAPQQIKATFARAAGMTSIGTCVGGGGGAGTYSAGQGAGAGGASTVIFSNPAVTYTFAGGAGGRAGTSGSSGGGGGGGGATFVWVMNSGYPIFLVAAGGGGGGGGGSSGTMPGGNASSVARALQTTFFGIGNTGARKSGNGGGGGGGGGNAGVINGGAPGWDSNVSSYGGLTGDLSYTTSFSGEATIENGKLTNGGTAGTSTAVATAGGAGYYKITFR
jgi:hypothetical protein